MTYAGDEYAIHTVIHGLGHVWDWRNGLSLSKGMGRDIETLDCFDHPMYGEICLFYIDRIKEKPPGELGGPYAGKNAMEDWADSFANYVYDQYYRRVGYKLLDTGGARERYIEKQLQAVR